MSSQSQKTRGEQTDFGDNKQSASVEHQEGGRKQGGGAMKAGGGAMRWGRREEVASEKKTLKSFARLLGKVYAPQFTTQSPPLGFGGPLDSPFLLLHHCQVKS